jgi:hypothetical protein
MSKMMNLPVRLSIHLKVRRELFIAISHFFDNMLMDWKNIGN